MIDERINMALNELEANLRKLESAREQVEKTVNSYDGLNSTTTEYVSKLDTITTNIRELVDVIGKDYDQKVKAFEKDCETVVNSSSSATKNLSDATEEFKNSLVEIKTKLKYSLIVNAVSFAATAAILFYLLK